MKITIYLDKEKTNSIYKDVDLTQYLIITANELWGAHWQVIEYGDVVIRKETQE